MVGAWSSVPTSSTEWGKGDFVVLQILGRISPSQYHQTAGDLGNILQQHLEYHRFPVHVLPTALQDLAESKVWIQMWPSLTLAHGKMLRFWLSIS